MHLGQAGLGFWVEVLGFEFGKALFANCTAKLHCLCRNTWKPKSPIFTREFPEVLGFFRFVNLRVYDLHEAKHAFLGEPCTFGLVSELCV